MMHNLPRIGRTSSHGSWLLVALAALALTILTGCTTSGLLQAASDKGAAAARVTLPALPDDCREQEPHAVAVVGDEARAVLKDERRHLDRANARVTRCADHYDRTVAALR